MNGGNDMYQANDGKWYPSTSTAFPLSCLYSWPEQGMPQGWQQGPDGSYVGPNGQQQYGGGGYQQQQQGNYWG